MRVLDPMLRLEHHAALRGLPDDAKTALRLVLLDLRADAQTQAANAWRRHKGPMAAYWKAVSVYAGHFARLVRVSP